MSPQATSKEGKEGGIELIQPPANSKPGDRVYFEGGEFECMFFPVPVAPRQSANFPLSQRQHLYPNSTRRKRYLRLSSQVLLFPSVPVAAC